MIRRRAGGTLRALVAAIALAALTAAGCGQGGAADEVAVPGTQTMTEEDYIAHIAALTIAVEEGLAGAAADARAIELGGGAHSREEIEELAELLRTRPERWLEMEKEVDRRITDLRRELGREDEPADR